jgi:putative ATPase
MIKIGPLAELMRAQSLAFVVGQDHLVGPTGAITKIIAANKPRSILLWGPPGAGKTTIARLYAQAFALRCVNLSATSAKVSDIKNIIDEQKKSPLFSSSIVIFMDEIHRFNKAQQDAFLPHVEDGTIVLVGATTENPSFYLNGALLSRCLVFCCMALDDDALLKLLAGYEKKIGVLPLDDAARKFLVEAARGDGRFLFNLVESIAALAPDKILDAEALKSILPKHTVMHDRDGDNHYNLISALHKSVRSSDPDAALYWLARMVKGGEDPLFIARRLIRMASEDIGLADPDALPLCIAARDSYQMLGSPEGELALAEACVYLALAPKSNSIYVAMKKAIELAEKSAHLPPPLQILNAPTKLMKDLGYGQNYVYDHDTELGCSLANNFPDQVPRASLYQPVERGFEREMKKRLDYFKALRQKKITNQTK